MGSSQSWVCWHRNSHLLIPILLVLVSTHLSFISQGARSIPSELSEAVTENGTFSQQGHVLEDENGGGEERVNARQIWSRPPQCRRACGGCGHCVAVQVPVAPQKHNNGEKRSSQGSGGDNSSTTRKISPKRTAYSRGGDELSNYKPIRWKCMCGDLLFNP